MRGTAVSEWVCGNCKSINRAAAGSCYSCGGSKQANAVTTPVPTQAPTSATLGARVAATPDASGGAPGAIAGGPFGFPTTSAAMPQMSPPRAASMSDVLGGLVAGLVAAILATAIWYGVIVVTHYEFGIVAIAVGFLVGQGVVLGARGRASIALVVISPLLTLLALGIGEYLIVAYFVGQEVGVPIDVVQPLDFIVSVVVDSITADPITLAFWAIALFQAVAIPWRALTRWTPTTDLPAVHDIPAPNEAPAA
jgi:hypothetical protein